MNPADLILVFDEYLKKSGNKKNYIANKLKELFESTTSPLNPDGKPMETLKDNLKSFNKKLKDFKFPSMYAFDVALKGALKEIRDFRDSFKNSNMKNFMKAFGNIQPSNIGKGGIDYSKTFADMNASLKKVIKIIQKTKIEPATRPRDQYSPYYNENDNFVKRYVKLLNARSDYARKQKDNNFVRGESLGLFSAIVGKIVGAAIAFSVVYYLNENLNKTTRGMALKELVKNFLYNVFDKTMDVLASPETASKIIEGGGVILKTLTTLLWNITKITLSKVWENIVGGFSSLLKGEFGEAGKYFAGALIAGGLGFLAIMRVWAIGKLIPGINLIFIGIELALKKISIAALSRISKLFPDNSGSRGGSQRGGSQRGRGRGRGGRVRTPTRRPPVPSKGILSKIFKGISEMFKKLLPLIYAFFGDIIRRILPTILNFFKKQFFQTLLRGLAGLFSVAALQIAGIIAATYFAGKALYSIGKSILQTNAINKETQENAEKWNKTNKQVLTKQEDRRNSDTDPKNKKINEYRNKISQNLKVQSDLNEAIAKRSTFWRQASDSIFGSNLSGESEEQSKERMRLFEENRRLEELINDETRKQKELERPQPKERVEIETTPLAKKSTKSSPFITDDKGVNQDKEKIAMENYIKSISDKLDMLATIFASGTQSIASATMDGSSIVAQAVASNSQGSVSVASSDPISEFRKRAERYA